MAPTSLLDGLAFRVGLLLSIAFLPIGLISISSTRQVAQENTRRAEATLLALTAEAAASEESFLRAGITVASTLASAMAVIRDDPKACSAIFTGFIARNPEYSFAGYTAADGTLRCGSAAVGQNFADSTFFRQMQADPSPKVDVRLMGQISKLPVVVLAQPLFDDQGGFDGFVSVSLPNERIFRRIGVLSAERPIELITFNSTGDILSAEGDLATAGAQLPKALPLKSFVGHPRTAFTGETPLGERRVFAVVPIISDKVYAMGSWPARPVAPFIWSLYLSPLVFAALMWLVSLGVAYMAVHRLAIRNIAALRSRMRSFMATRRFERSTRLAAKPLEFREIEQTWEDIADTVVREEAELENIIHDRTVLLKEVHHRVKNNLQLIASIVSMKIRKAATPEARVALKEVQMRVMSIATVHQALYLTSTIGRVRADELLRTIADKTISAGLHAPGAIRIETAYDPVELYPDQAVPLSLLASEALTNALKYVGRPSGGDAPWITLRLTRPAADTAVLEVANSCGDPLLPPAQVRGTGLGASLINAFTHQLHGTLESGGRSVDPVADPSADTCVVRVRFPIATFSDAAVEAGFSDTV